MADAREWFRMTTAPRDGTPIRISFGQWQAIVRWHRGRQTWVLHGPTEVAHEQTESGMRWTHLDYPSEPP